MTEKWRSMLDLIKSEKHKAGAGTCFVTVGADMLIALIQTDMDSEKKDAEIEFLKRQNAELAKGTEALMRDLPKRDYLKCRKCGTCSENLGIVVGVLRLLDQGWTAVNQVVEYECPECSQETREANRT